MKTIVLIGILSLLVGCNGAGKQNSIIGSPKELKSPQNQVDIQSHSGCKSYLTGKTFYSSKARVEFLLDNNAYIYRKADNSPVFTGYVTIDETQGVGRIIKIHDTLGSGQVIILVLSENGNLLDLSDNTMYQPL